MRKSAYPLCRHTKADGRLCQSPALVDSAFCHHHQKLHRTRRNTISAGPGLSTNVLHPLHNARTIVQALNMVVHALATNQLHPKRAGKMIYALQIAANNLPRHQ